MTVTDSTLIGNQALGGPGADGESALGQGIGGGIMNAAGAILTVRNSSLIGNQAIGGNGATPTIDNPLGRWTRRGHRELRRPELRHG